VKDNYNITCTC